MQAAFFAQVAIKASHFSEGALLASRAERRFPSGMTNKKNEGDGQSHGSKKLAMKRPDGWAPLQAQFAEAGEGRKDWAAM